MKPITTLNMLAKANWSIVNVAQAVNSITFQNDSLNKR